MTRVDGTPTTGTATAPTESGVAGFDQTKTAKGFLGTTDPLGHPTGVFGTSPGHGVVGQTASSAAFGILGVNTANYPPSFGILLPLIIEGNTLRDNQTHIALIR